MNVEDGTTDHKSYVFFVWHVCASLTVEQERSVKMVTTPLLVVT